MEPAATATPRQQRRWEVEKQQIVYPAYDNLQVLMWAVQHPQEWRRRKDGVRRVRGAYQKLGAILRDEHNAELISAWFGDETGAVVKTMVDVREKVRRLIPR